MIGSDREKYGINIYFSYDIASKLNVRNDLSVDDVKGSDSPYGSFSQYAQMNPYERIQDENGDLIRYYERNNNRISNPLINVGLPNYSFDKYTQVTDNLQFQYWPIQNLFIKGNIALTKQIDRSESFYQLLRPLLNRSQMPMRKDLLQSATAIVWMLPEEYPLVTTTIFLKNYP